jgi:hypothetical protein
MNDFDPGRLFPDFRSAFEESTGEDDDGFRSRFSKIFSPVSPYNRFPLLVPVISVLGGVTVFAMTGLAIASFVVMSFALLVVVYLLSEVFGFEMAMPVMPGAPR